MCFVEDCDKLCADPAKRRLHVIDKHNYPKVSNLLNTPSACLWKSALIIYLLQITSSVKGL